MSFSDISCGVIYAGFAPTHSLLVNQLEVSFNTIVSEVKCDTVVLVTSPNTVRYSYRMYPVAARNSLMRKECMDDYQHLTNDGYKVEVITIEKNSDGSPTISVVPFGKYVRNNNLRLVCSHISSTDPQT